MAQNQVTSSCNCCVGGHAAPIVGLPERLDDVDQKSLFEGQRWPNSRSWSFVWSIAAAFGPIKIYLPKHYDQ